jgi:hypothetical protein
MGSPRGDPFFVPTLEFAWVAGWVGPKTAQKRRILGFWTVGRKRAAEGAAADPSIVLWLCKIVAPVRRLADLTGVWFRAPVTFLLCFAEDGPALEVEGKCGHAHLKIGIAHAIANGIACAVIADETSDDAFDGRAEFHVELECGGFGVENGAALPIAVGTDEDLAESGGLWGFGLFDLGRFGLGLRDNRLGGGGCGVGRLNFPLLGLLIVAGGSE